MPPECRSSPPFELCSQAILRQFTSTLILGRFSGRTPTDEARSLGLPWAVQIRPQRLVSSTTRQASAIDLSESGQ